MDPAMLDVDAIADSTRDLLRELAAVRAEGEALRRELEMAWELSDDDDHRPTLIPDVEIEIEIDFEPRDTMRC